MTTQTMPLHEAMRQGAADPHFQEVKTAYFAYRYNAAGDVGGARRRPCGCALGGAYWAAGWTKEEEVLGDVFGPEAVGDVFGPEAVGRYPRALELELTMMHVEGAPAAEIADWVEAHHPALTIPVKAAAGSSA